MQTAHGKAKETEPDTEKWITLISKCTERLGLSETCITALKDKVSKEQAAAKSIQGIKTMLATIKKFCRRARYVPPTPVIEFLVSPVLLDIADEHHMTHLQFEQLPHS